MSFDEWDKIEVYAGDRLIATFYDGYDADEYVEYLCTIGIEALTCPAFDAEKKQEGTQTSSGEEM